MPADVPLSRMDGLDAWAQGLNLAPGRGAWDVGLTGTEPGGLEARARAAIGITVNVDAEAEAFATTNSAGLIAGLVGHF